MAPRPSTLTRSRILDAALELAAAEGITAVTMRAVAAQLGVTPMALYRHVAGKQELLDGVVERLLEELPVPDPALEPATRLTRIAEGLRAVARRHPDAFLMLFRRPAATGAALRRRDAVRTALADAGVARADVDRAERLLSTFVLGFAASEACGRFAERDPRAVEADWEWARTRLLRELVAPRD